MEKIDLKKTYKHLYLPSTGNIVRVDVPALHFLMIDGEGDPNTSQSFAESVEGLFSLSYGLKFRIKKSPLMIDYGVMPLEALWWADDPSAFTDGDKSRWKWTVMVMQPDWVTEDLVALVLSDVKRKKPSPALSRARFASFSEGLCAQVMHIGPFSEEGPTIEKVHQFIESCGCKRRGKHHEIYLSDMRRADPAKWKTVIRQPMQ